MTNKEILEKAIEKAVKNGFTYDRTVAFLEGAQMIKEIVFSHPFAKAFWGEEIIHDDEYCVRSDPYNMVEPCPFAWQVYIQQMVISEEPIKYLEQFI